MLIWKAYHRNCDLFNKQGVTQRAQCINLHRKQIYKIGEENQYQFNCATVT